MPANQEPQELGRRQGHTLSQETNAAVAWMSDLCIPESRTLAVPMLKPPSVWHLVMDAPENCHCPPSLSDWSCTWLLWLRAHVGLGNPAQWAHRVHVLRPLTPTTILFSLQNAPPDRTPFSLLLLGSTSAPAQEVFLCPLCPSLVPATF